MLALKLFLKLILALYSFRVSVLFIVDVWGFSIQFLASDKTLARYYTHSINWLIGNIRVHICVKDLSSKRIGMNGHILYVGVSQWSECLFIDRKFLYFIQCFQAIDNPAC